MKPHTVFADFTMVIVATLMLHSPVQAQDAAGASVLLSAPVSSKPLADHLRWLNNPGSHIQIQMRLKRAIVEREKSGVPAFKTNAAGEEQSLHEGDYFTIEVRNFGHIPVYLTLFDIGSGNDISILNPGIILPSGQVVPNTKGVYVPNTNGKWIGFGGSYGKTSPFVYTIVPPYGSEICKMIATEKPVDFSDYQNSSFDKLISGEWTTVTYRFIATAIKHPHVVAPPQGASRGTIDVSAQIIDKTVRDHVLGRRDRALIFGSNDYQHWPPLSNPLHDAEAIKATLVSKYGFDAQIVANAKRQVVKEMLRKYQELVYEDYDQLFVYFAGHGAFDSKYTDQGYIVTTDSPDASGGYDECISFNDLQQMLDKIPCKHIFLVLDTCYGGTYDPLMRHALAGCTKIRLTSDDSVPLKQDSVPLANEAIPAPDSSDDTRSPDYIASLMGNKTRLFLSSGAKEPVPDGKPGEGSPFAQLFLDALRHGDRQGMLFFGDIKRYVFLANPKPHAGEFDDNVYGGDFVFITH